MVEAAIHPTSAATAANTAPMIAMSPSSTTTGAYAAATG